MRKTVTVLFADVTGSTALGERLDPEAFRRVMARYFEVAREAVERHGGTVEKFIGDAVMAVFGVPTVHEDDALRAVRAAAELRGSLDGLNLALERDYGVSLELRTGVNTGEVVAGTRERLATGDAVNVAARLEQAAEPGEILLGERTAGLVRGAVEVEAAEPLIVKGKSEPLKAHRLSRRGRGGIRLRAATRWAVRRPPSRGRSGARRVRRGTLEAHLPDGPGARAAGDREVAPRDRGQRARSRARPPSRAAAASHTATASRTGP